MTASPGLPRLPALVLAGLLLVAASSPAAAQGIPVEDTLAKLEIIAVAGALADIYARQNDELTEARRVMRSVTRALGLGTLHQTPQLAAMRRRLPVLMYDLRRLQDLAADPDLVQALTVHRRITDRYGLLEPTAYEPTDPTAPYALAWADDRNAQLAAATSAEVVYQNVDDREDLYEELMTELDTGEDLKMSVDILARLTAENGRLLMELIRLQSSTTQAAATSQLAQQTQAAKVRRMAEYEDLDMADW